MEDSLRHQAREAREQVAAGALRGPALLQQLLSVPFLDRDAWTDELLDMEPPPADADLPRGAVPYLPCGVDEILSLVRDVPVTREDQLVDLGSGLGRVVLLAHLLSGARAHGIEIQGHLVNHATARCVELALRDVTFTHADACESELDGSIFFLYTPCNGDMLIRLLGRLECVARRRSIVVCTVGVDLSDVSWLVTRSSSRGLTIYDSALA